MVSPSFVLNPQVNARLPLFFEKLFSIFWEIFLPFPICQPFFFFVSVIVVVAVSFPFSRFLAVEVVSSSDLATSVKPSFGVPSCADVFCRAGRGRGE